MRGPGDIEGTQQSGLPMDLHISDLAKDSQILEEARNMAMLVLENDPLLEKSENFLLKTGLSRLRREVKDFSQIS
jgi:ATP-dependent DNA helicase RecG